MSLVYVVTQTEYGDPGAGFQGPRSARERSTLQFRVVGVFTHEAQARAAGGEVHAVEVDDRVPAPVPERPYEDLGTWGKRARDLRKPPEQASA